MKIKSAAFINALNNELAERRRRVARIRRERTAEVYSAIPGLKEFDDSIMDIALDMGKKVIGAPDADEISALAEALIRAKTAEREAMLERHGFRYDYTDVQFICPDCRDTGRINGELCHCVTQLAVKIAFEDSGINPNQNFANFDLDLQQSRINRSAMAKVRDQAIDYADSFPNNAKRDIVYFGPAGVGKTYLLNCIGGRVLERGFSVLKINAHSLIQLTLDNLRSSPEDRPDFLLPDLLIIDDLGTEPMIPNITIETLLSILCQRQDLGKATLFATNLEIVPDDEGCDTIQSTYGERFASRLMSPRCVRLQAIRTDNVRLSDPVTRVH